MAARHAPNQYLDKCLGKRGDGYIIIVICKASALFFNLPIPYLETNGIAIFFWQPLYFFI